MAMYIRQPWARVGVSLQSPTWVVKAVVWDDAAGDYVRDTNGLPVISVRRVSPKGAPVPVLVPTPTPTPSVETMPPLPVVFP